jgi:hypothetical protein
MRKFIFVMMLAIVSLLTSCEGKKNEEQQNFNDETKVESLVVDNTISTDREFMFLNYGGDYRWFETCILMKNFMDEETDGSVEAVTSIFQVVAEVESGCYDTHVIMTVHTLDTSTIEVKEGFWVEDYPLNNEDICISFEEAFTKLMEANCPKPHSKHCVLRKEVGPVSANPQYIFGNNKCQVYVDATTGDVSTINPVFPDANLNGPLGEWP